MKLSLQLLKEVAGKAAYNGVTRLRAWWKIVNQNFIDIEDAHNALDDALSEEAAERERVDGVLSDNITDAVAAIVLETAEREDADKSLSTAIKNEATDRENADKALSDAIGKEAKERKAADKGLADDIAKNKKAIEDEAAARKQTDEKLKTETDARKQTDENLDKEIKERKASDTEFSADIKTLKEQAHTHDNKELLDTITQNRMKIWDAEGGDKVLFRNAMYDAVNMFREIYRAVGIDIYDGGYVNMTVIDKTIDGGSVTDTDIRLTIDGGEITERRKAGNNEFATTEEIIEEWNREEE